MRFDGILVGGGLQSCLIARAVLARDPGAKLAVIERGEKLGGEHTWCFHSGDLDGGMEDVVKPLVVRRWPAYDVRFPEGARRIDRGYAMLHSERLAEVMTAELEHAPGTKLLLGAAATQVASDAVTLEDGEVLNAPWVIDSRGPESLRLNGGAFQKFVGLELSLASPWRSELPLIMDATVPQTDGFRFMYSLPLSPSRVLLEDTYYSESAVLDVPELTRRILAYAEATGVKVVSVVRTERGVLPIPLGPLTPPDVSPLQGGYAGGWFHATTGYSLPAAARLARLVAESWPSAPTAQALSRLRRELSCQNKFFRVLNRLLFRAYEGPKRWQALARFYRMPEATIERFYAMRTTRWDQARILLGRPPRGVSLTRAFAELTHATK